jgi:tRNA(adenine34) deaminase
VPDEQTYGGYMDEALQLADEAKMYGDVPVGAVVVSSEGDILGVGYNQRERLDDPTAHAEVVALRAAAAPGHSWHLDDCTLVVTLEPCIMCAGALMLARIGRVVFGTWDPKAGACGSVWDLVRDRRATHQVEVIGGIREAECMRMLVNFFEDRRL